MHKPVLVNEVMENLDIKPGEVVVDTTFGFGGHSKLISEKIGLKGLLIGIEQDEEVLSQVRDDFQKPNTKLIRANFRDLASILDGMQISKIDKILFDLGVASFHLDESKRGISFKGDEPLDMRLDKSKSVMASDIINEASEKELADIFYNFADEYLSRQIAKAIVDRRRKRKFLRTSDLVSEIVKIKGNKHGKTNPATKVFQALRIAVNDEYRAISEGVAAAIEKLNIGGRVAVISFHSGEDRLIKNIFKSNADVGSIKIITKKPIVPTRNEIRGNIRSRSAKLRVAERIK